MPALGIWSQKLLPNQPQILEIDEDVRITNVTLSDTSNSKQKSFVKILHEPHDDDDEDDDDDEAIANSSLAKLIKQRTQKREDELNNVVNSIESKYLKPSKSKKSKGKEKEKATSSKNKKRIAESDEDNDDKKHEESDETKRPNNKKKKN